MRFQSVADNILMDETIQSAEQNKEIHLSEMPIEMLKHILIHLDDKNLVVTSHVCKSFASAAELAFEQNYSKKYYVIHDKDKNSIDKGMLTKYGTKIRKIKFSVYYNDVGYGASLELLDLIEQKCCNLKSIELHRTPRMIVLKDLKEVILDGVYNLNLEIFAGFINNNQQLETLAIFEADVHLVDILDGRLDKLTSLVYDSDTNFTTDLPEIHLNSLKTLEVNLPDNEDFVRLLRAMNCNPIEKLTVWIHTVPDENDDVINEICAFKSLVSLDFKYSMVSADQMRNLAHHLLHLTELSIHMDESDESNAVNQISSVLSILRNLTKLDIHLDDFDRLLPDLKNSVRDFHARFASTNTEINISDNINKVSTSEERIFVFEGGSVELHWMANLNEKNVRKVMDGVPIIRKMKFINHCAGPALDISTFSTRYDEISSLDIKSFGPIIANANVSVTE